MDRHHDNQLQLFHFFPIYSTDPVVRRAYSLQKTKQARKPVAIFNPTDFSEARLSDGEDIKLIFGKEQIHNEFILEAVSDAKVARGVIAVAVGSLKSPNVGGVITGFEKLRN